MRKIKRAWPIDGLIRKYFILREAGGPSKTIDYSRDGSPGGGSPPPDWLIGNCEIGIALSKLPAHQLVAFWLRWWSVICQEREQRVAQIAARRIVILEAEAADCNLAVAEFKRRGDQEARASRQRRHNRVVVEIAQMKAIRDEAEEAAHAYRDERRKNEWLTAYQHAMTALTEKLSR